MLSLTALAELDMDDLQIAPNDGCNSKTDVTMLNEHSSVRSCLARIHQLEAELTEVRAAFESVRAAARDKFSNDMASAEQNTSENLTSSQADDDSHYFESYSQLDIHETMLKGPLRLTTTFLLHS